MLALESKPKKSPLTIIIICIAVLCLIGGLYVLSLVVAPTIAPYIANKPIDTTTLSVPKINENRIIIPRIGVDIHYAPGTAALDRGAEWRFPERGNPETGGNFIIAAHRFSIQPTPQGTIEKSPFYHIDKLIQDDQVLIDYNGARYLYKIKKIFTVKPAQIEIEAPSDTPVLTIYTCSLSGASDGRVVLIAEPLGEVKI